MAKSIGELAQGVVDRLRARVQSTDRWFMDREGNVHLNVESMRRKPITDDEIAAIDEAVRDFPGTSTELH